MRNGIFIPWLGEHKGFCANIQVVILERIGSLGSLNFLQHNSDVVRKGTDRTRLAFRPFGQFLTLLGGKIGKLILLSCTNRCIETFFRAVEPYHDAFP